MTNRRILILTLFSVIYGLVAYSFGVFLFFLGLSICIVWALEVLNV